MFIKQGKTNIKYLLIVIVLAAIVGAGILWCATRKEVPSSQEKPEIVAEKYCEKDTDCVCGVHVNTRDCFYGNKNYVDTKQQCPDFCSGFTGDLVIKCVNNQCVQTKLEKTEGGIVDWKTYRNEEHGFEVKYPLDWQVSFKKPETGVSFAPSRCCLSGFTVQVRREPKLDYLENIRMLSNKKEPDLLTVDGYPAAYIRMRDEDLPSPKPNPFNLVTIQKGETRYEIFQQLTTDILEQENSTEIFDQMLFTFKILGR